MDRIDVLQDHEASRLDVLTGTVLAEELDEELQAAVRALATELRTPIALVSLVLRKTQFFRAHVGLPPDLARTRATDRDVSFCQFVVRDGRRFEVSDARLDERVPKELVRTYGIRAYIGQPVRVGSRVVGSLCAIDTVPRTFDDKERAQLEHLAEKVTQRLTELAKTRAHVVAAGLEEATRPAFAELRNALTPVVLGLGAARTTLAELRTLARTVALGEVDVLREATRASSLAASVEELSANVTDMQDAFERIQAGVTALERALTAATKPAHLGEIVSISSQLASHHIRANGGLQLGHHDRGLLIHLPRAVAINAVTALLAFVGRASSAASVRSTASGRSGGASGAITLTCALSAGRVTLRFEAPLPQATLDEIAGEWSSLFAGEPGISLARVGEGLELQLPA